MGNNPALSSRHAFVQGRVFSPPFQPKRFHLSPSTTHPVTSPPRRHVRMNVMPLLEPPESILPLSIPMPSVESHDAALTGAILGIVVVWLGLWERLTSWRVVSSSVTRKVIHISCGPALIFLWPLFTDAASARYVAAIVPLLFICVLAISGTAKANEHKRAALGRSISRGGEPKEALEGPLYYSLVLCLLTLLLFKSAAAAVAVMQLCLGDGAAEVIGKRYGKNSKWELSWTGSKSVVGSAAFVVAAFLGSVGGVAWLHYCDLTKISVADPSTLVGLSLVSVACAALELVPKEVAGDDNLSIAALAATLTFALFGTQALY